MMPVAWLDSPDGTLWHPAALIFGRDARLIISALFGSLVAFAASHVFSRLDERRREAPVKVVHPTPLQVLPGWEGKLLDSTSLLDPKDQLGSHIRCFDASTGWHLETLEADTPYTIDSKLELATVAAESWKDSTWLIRRKLLKSILEWILFDQERIVRVACRDTGKAVSLAAKSRRCMTARIYSDLPTAFRPWTPSLARSSSPHQSFGISSTTLPRLLSRSHDRMATCFWRTRNQLSTTSLMALSWPQSLGTILSTTSLDQSRPLLPAEMQSLSNHRSMSLSAQTTTSSAYIVSLLQSSCQLALSHSSFAIPHWPRIYRCTRASSTSPSLEARASVVRLWSTLLTT